MQRKHDRIDAVLRAMRMCIDINLDSDLLATKTRIDTAVTRINTLTSVLDVLNTIRTPITDDQQRTLQKCRDDAMHAINQCKSTIEVLSAPPSYAETMLVKRQAPNMASTPLGAPNMARGAPNMASTEEATDFIIRTIRSGIDIKFTDCTWLSAETRIDFLRTRINNLYVALNVLNMIQTQITDDQQQTLQKCRDDAMRMIDECNKTIDVLSALQSDAEMAPVMASNDVSPPNILVKVSPLELDVLQKSREFAIRGRILAAIAAKKSADEIAALKGELKKQQEGVPLALPAPKDGFVRCDISEDELALVNEVRADKVGMDTVRLKQEIAHFAQGQFDVTKTDVFIEHMKKLHADLEALKKGPDPVRVISA